MSNPDAIDVTNATLLNVTGGVATVTLNRPDNRNALSTVLVESLAAHLHEALDRDDVRVVVLTGAGTTFCAGADLKERRTVVAAAGELPTFVKVFQMIRASSKPVVAKLNGHALAGGLGLACSCDISIAPERATFGFTEVRIGVAPAIISVVCLPKLRAADAAELFLTGERIGARRAAEVGLINRAVPDNQLDAVTDELVAKLLLGAPKAMAATKQLLQQVQRMDEGAAFAWTAKLSGELFASDEASEGMSAFAAKRPAVWTL